MSASQLTNASASGEWLPQAADPGAERSGEHATGKAAARRQRFIRLVKLTMAGLVAFTALGLASYVWRRHTMSQALAESVPAPTPVAPAATAVAPPAVNEPTAAAAPAVPKAEEARTPAAKAAVPRKAVSKSSRSPFLSATKKPAKVATRPAR